MVYSSGYHLTPVVQGDLTQKFEIQVEGEMLTLKDIIVVWLFDIIHHSWICIQVPSTLW
jgi:hypothetical protein